MSNGAFTTTERNDAQGQALKILWRFVAELKLLHILFLPYLLILVVSTILPQIFIWLTGEYNKCSPQAPCEVTAGGYVISLSFTFLFVTVLLAIIFRILCWTIFEVGGQWSSRALHAKMVRAVANVRTTFFDENPSGRLINRLIRDFDNLRYTGVVRLGDAFCALAEVFCAAGLVVFAHPVGALLIIPTLLGFMYIQSNVAPMLHRCGTLRSVRFGEVLHRETDFIEGGRTFLLYGREKALKQRLHNSLSKFIQAHLLSARVEGWGRFWTTVLTALYGLASLLLVAYALHEKQITPVLAAVIITVVYRLAPSFGWLTWISAFILDTVATARRVFEFVDLPDERTSEFAESRPQRKERGVAGLAGDIEFHNYSMSYRNDSPLILNELSMSIPRGKRIGIIGRTGAGKSSIVQSLYRMVCVRGGDITIGGTSIFDRDVSEIRNLLFVVPQDPYLFEGSLRSNLDREQLHPDSELEITLERAGLPLPLSTSVTEGGKNLSLGERQLICLARAILSGRPIIIMDEPTSGVDTLTDARVQALITKYLVDRTVITIAHRLGTLIGYDKVIELSYGKKVAEGTPESMIARDGSLRSSAS